MKRGPLKVHTAHKEALAARFVSGHFSFKREGLVLTGATRFWLTGRGTITGRFVYRNRRQDLTVVFTIRELRLERSK